MLSLSHKTLKVYNISLQIIDEVYKITKSFPREELYVLVSQIRRASISIASNIAEGASRQTKKEKKRFYEIARSSLVEMDTQFEIALLQKIIFEENIRSLEQNMISCFRMLSTMIKNLEL